MAAAKSAATTHAARPPARRADESLTPCTARNGANSRAAKSTVTSASSREGSEHSTFATTYAAPWTLPKRLRIS